MGCTVKPRHASHCASRVATVSFSAPPPPMMQVSGALSGLRRAARGAGPEQVPMANDELQRQYHLIVDGGARHTEPPRPPPREVEGACPVCLEDFRRNVKGGAAKVGGVRKVALAPGGGCDRGCLGLIRGMRGLVTADARPWLTILCGSPARPRRARHA